MYELDEQEYILSKNPTGQENLIKEKKRKLKDMFEKVLMFHIAPGNKKSVPLIPSNILPPGPPPTLPPNDSLPVPTEILNQLMSNINHTLTQCDQAMQLSAAYFYDPLPPPPPP
ncbi:hypothetical protein MXB_5112, partial [Myxobolus squamalis]